MPHFSDWPTAGRPSAGHPAPSVWQSLSVHSGTSNFAAMHAVEDEKRQAAEAAAELVEDGMLVGLGTGSTVSHLLPALAARSLSIRCVATSPRTEELARELGIEVEPFEDLDRLDIAID